jgi:hypothetical protein
MRLFKGALAVDGTLDVAVDPRDQLRTGYFRGRLK